MTRDKRVGGSRLLLFAFRGHEIKVGCDKTFCDFVLEGKLAITSHGAE